MSDKFSKEYRVWLYIKRNSICSFTGQKYRIPIFDTFEGFLQYIGLAPSKDHRLTRFDKSGDYEPGNIHWYLASKKKKI